MEGSEPLLPGITAEIEYAELNSLARECDLFLTKWRAYQPNESAASADAVVAVHNLRSLLVARRSYILGLLHQRDLPF